jgi:hypothetical protein
MSLSITIYRWMSIKKNNILCICPRLSVELQKFWCSLQIMILMLKFNLLLGSLAKGLI